MEAKEIDILWKIMDFFMLRFYALIFRQPASQPCTPSKNQYSKGFQRITRLFFLPRVSPADEIIENNPVIFPTGNAPPVQELPLKKEAGIIIFYAGATGYKKNIDIFTILLSERLVPK